MLSFLLALLFYFAPALIAYIKKHKHRETISVLNLLFGWTLVGWVLCLVWSLLG